jgi:SAM-dependent methyltransferase
MGNEASKTYALSENKIKALLQGDGLDIGAGSDPVIPNVTTFDQKDGDANLIDEYIHRQFDFVFSSHCLEHMHNPWDALPRWWKLVKPGGHLIVIVPDEDLYEQGYWPSLFNDDHKHTFTQKEKSPLPVSIQVKRLIATIPNATLVHLEEQSNGYDYSLLRSPPLPQHIAVKRIRLAKLLSKVLEPFMPNARKKLLTLLKAPIDQTAYGALAQIQFVLRKEPAPAQ